MHHYTKLSLMAYLLPMLFICCQGSQLNIGDQKLILVDSSYNFDDMPGMEDHDIFSGDLGIGSCIYRGTKQYICTAFDEELVQLVENNTIVAINSSMRLESRIIFSNITNMSIIGYDKTIEMFCAFKSVWFENCNNISIKNISWNQCGYNYGNPFLFLPDENIIPNFDDDFFLLHSSGLSFNFCTDISLKSCTFQDSMIEINTVSGAVCIDQIHFLSTNTVPLHSGTPLATGLIMHQENRTRLNNDVVVKVSNALFSQINSTLYDHALLLLYILVDDPGSTIQVFVNQSNFLSVSYRPDWEAENGMVWIRILSCKDAYIKFFEVNFQSNNVRSEFFASILLHIDITTFKVSRIISRVVIESCSFLGNSAQKIAYFEGDMYLDIVNTYFSNNKAASVIFVTTGFYNDRRYLASGYDNIYITTVIQVSQCSFFNNSGGHLMTLNGLYILAIISEVQIKHNVLLPAYCGLIVFQNYSTLVANITNIEYEFNYIEGEGAGFHFTSIPNIERPFLLIGDTVARYTAYIPANFQFSDLPIYGGQDKFFISYYQQFSFTNGCFINNTGGGHGAVIHFVIPQFGYHTSFVNMISTSIFNHNNGLTSLIYASISGFATVTLTVEDCMFMHNVGNVFYLQNQVLRFLNRTVFDNNRAQNGAALYLDLNSEVIFTNNSTVTFSNNVARRYGGAIYYDITQSSDACYRNLSALIIDGNNTSIDFRSNVAGIAGSSIYFSISQSCNATLQYDAQTSIFNLPGKIITPPNQLRLYHPAQLVNNSDPSSYYVSDVMLGQNIIIPACVLDYYGMPAGSVQFTIQLVDNNDHNYSIAVSDLISVDCNTLQGINNLVITGSRPSDNINSTLTIQLNSFYDSRFDWKPITVILNVQLSLCHSGFYYSSDLEHCVCYTTDNIVTCSDSNSTIRNGYWFGTVNEQPTVTICPINFCSFDDCEATTGTCNLYPLNNNQCRGHRSGTACGNCEEGYTLSFDSFDCIDTDQCTVGQTVLVITMSFLYWIVVIVLVFCMMYFKVGIGYLYGITFYYSIIDIVLGNTLLFTDSLYQLVTTLSSIAKLLPQFLGQLCFVKGLSGIDQQFIHYIHPLAILLILALISISTRYSPKLSLFVSRAVIHAICLLLLLSYSSIASTSLLLVRAITFTDVDETYSYLSPDIEYFHGRHLIYGLIAILIGLVIVIGLPLLLLLEPFLNSKINFIKIKPLLDQFQGCYQDRFRYFASYFLIFRLMILGILAINKPNPFTTLYSLQVICLIMILLHVTTKPYSNNLLNFFDSFMLINLVLVISLQIVETYHGFSRNATLGMAFVLVALPLFIFLLIVVYLNVENIRKMIGYFISSIKSSKSTESANNETTEMHQCDFIVDQNARDKSKTTIVDVDANDDRVSFQESLLELAIT